jgi:MFS family permease
MPPLLWGIGYFFWGWAADTFAATNPRPVGLMVLLTILSLSFGLTPLVGSVMLAVLLVSFSTFLAGGFQMVALKASSFTYPREKAALMTGIASGSWALVNTVISPIIGRMFDQRAWSQAFWLVALLPAVGTAIWFVLSAQKKELLDARLVFGILGVALGTWLKFLLRPQVPLQNQLGFLLVGGVIGLAVGVLIWMRKPGLHKA